MERMKRFAIVVMASLVVVHGSAPLEAWAQNAPPATAEPSAGQEALAGLTNVVYVPGKAIACTLTAALWVGIMAVTLGGGYKDGAKILEDGCGGKWALTAKDFQPSR
jgi:hypothetical protein